MSIRVTFEDQSAFLYTPYNTNFIDAIRNIGGAKWIRERKAWSIPAAAIDDARSIMRRVYGECDLPDDSARVTLKLTFHEEVDALRAPVILFGKTIASASGRDSGCIVGTDVSFLSGEPVSAGSAKNWYSRILADSVVILRNVPATLLDDPLPDGVEAVVADEKPDCAKLLQERERLLARIAEIEEQLRVLPEKESI